MRPLFSSLMVLLTSALAGCVSRPEAARATTPTGPSSSPPPANTASNAPAEPRGTSAGGSAPEAAKGATGPAEAVLTFTHPERVAGLDLRLLEATEKRTDDGRGAMRVTLEASLGSKKEKLELFRGGGEPPPSVTWEGYTITYLEGWRSDAKVRVTPPK